MNRDYTVRSRRSYVEKNENERMADRVVAQLFRPVVENALAVQAEIGTAKKKGRMISIPLKIRVPIGRLTLLPEGRFHAGAFTVFTASGGKVGVVSDVAQKTQAFRIPSAELVRARASHYTYELTVATDGGAEHLAIGVLDEVSKQFSVVRIALGRPEV